MSDLVVTVPKAKWQEWIDEGDLPGDPPGDMESHFWIGGPLPTVNPGDRIYVVAHGKLRGFAPLRRVELHCKLWPERSCLVRNGDAVAVTIAEPIRGFRGWRYRWWNRDDEVPFPDWRSVE